MDSQDKKFLMIGTGVILAFIVVAVLVLRKKPSPQEEVQVIEALPVKQFDLKIDASTPCPGPEIKYRMVDGSMAGIIEKDEQVDVVINYFACNPILKDQLVLYRFSGAVDPVLRRVVAVEGDTFKVQKDTKHKAWNLLVNGKIVKSQNGEPHYFGFDQPPTLSLYEAPRKGKLQKDETLVFTSNPPSEKDSGTFGLTSKTDMVGLVKK
ncbi:MAG: hypothetical protein K2X47_06165 [Bdellovibrionales bacterium]|nr:hypothetical protein [Bdellovibrionales bacterium]